MVFTQSMAGEIAEEVIGSLSDVYQKRDVNYNQALVVDLLLLQDTLTWVTRKRLIDAGSGLLNP